MRSGLKPESDPLPRRRCPVVEDDLGSKGSKKNWPLGPCRCRLTCRQQDKHRPDRVPRVPRQHRQSLEVILPPVSGREIADQKSCQDSERDSWDGQDEQHRDEHEFSRDPAASPDLELDLRRQRVHPQKEEEGAGRGMTRRGEQRDEGDRGGGEAATDEDGCPSLALGKGKSAPATRLFDERVDFRIKVYSNSRIYSEVVRRFRRVDCCC